MVRKISHGDSMKIKQIYLSSFGKWGKQSFSFDESSCFIFGNNESGKSTLFKALIAAFYGIGGKREGREKHFAWIPFQEQGSTLPCSIQIEFSHLEKNYLLERNFGKTASGDKIVLRSLPLGTEIPLVKIEPGEFLFKLNRTSFENLCFLGHQGGSFTFSQDKNKELLEKLKQLGQSGSEDTSLEKTERHLQFFSEALLSKNQTKGKIVLWKKRLEKLKKIKTFYLEHEQKQNTFLEKIQEAEKNVQFYAEKLQSLAFLQKTNEENLQDVNLHLQKEKENEQDYEAKKLSLSEENLTLLQKENQLKSLLLQEKEQSKNHQEQRLAQQQAIQKTEKEILEIKNAEERSLLSLKKNLFLLYTSLACLLVFIGTAFFFSSVHSLKLLPIFSLLALIFVGLQRKHLHKEKKMFLSLNDEKRKEQEQKILFFNTWLMQEEAQQKEFSSFLKLFQENFEKEKEQFQAKKNQYLSLPNKKEVLAALTEKLQQLQAEKQNLTNTHAAYNEKWISWQLALEACKTEQKLLVPKAYDFRTIELALQQVQEEVDQSEKLYAYVSHALHTLAYVKNFLAEQMSPKLLEKTKAYLSFLSEGRYDKLFINQELEMQVFCPEDQSYHDLDCLSQGTIELIYFSLRLALLHYFEENDPSLAPLPLLLDDAFVHLDEKRKNKAFELLTQEQRQCLYFSKQKSEKELFQKWKQISFSEQS